MLHPLRAKALQLRVWLRPVQGLSSTRAGLEQVQNKDFSRWFGKGVSSAPTPRASTGSAPVQQRVSPRGPQREEHPCWWLLRGTSVPFRNPRPVRVIGPTPSSERARFGPAESAYINTASLCC